MRDRPLLAADEIFHSNLRPFVAENDGKARAALLGQSELARHFRRRQGVIDTVSAIAQLLHHGNGISALFFLRDDQINLDRAYGRDRFFHLGARSRRFSIMLLSFTLSPPFSKISNTGPANFPSRSSVFSRGSRSDLSIVCNISSQRSGGTFSSLSNSVQNSRSLMRTTKSCEVKPKTRTTSMASAIN